MAGSTMVAFKSALVVNLAALPGMAGVKVSYADPGDKALKENVWCGRITDNEHEAVALRAGRRRREENFTAEVFIEVVGTRLTAERAETRALALGLVLEEYLADNPKLDGSVDGLAFAVISSMELATLETTEGPQTRLTVGIYVKARLL
jgi:hypothetical protein